MVTVERCELFKAGAAVVGAPSWNDAARAAWLADHAAACEAADAFAQPAPAAIVDNTYDEFAAKVTDWSAVVYVESALSYLLIMVTA